MPVVSIRPQLVRWQAVSSLGRIWQRESLMNLGSPDIQIRQTAAKDLCDSPELRFIDPLIATLRDRDSVVRDYAAQALGKLGEVAVDSLVPLLHYQDREIGRSVAKAFAEFYDSDSLERIRYILLSAIRDHRWWVRESATEALVKLGGRGLPVLKIIIRSPDPELRELARFVLRRIGTIPALDLIIPESLVNSRHERNTRDCAMKMLNARFQGEFKESLRHPLPHPQGGLSGFEYAGIPPSSVEAFSSAC